MQLRAKRPRQHLDLSPWSRGFDPFGQEVSTRFASHRVLGVLRLALIEMEPATWGDPCAAADASVMTGVDVKSAADGPRQLRSFFCGLQTESANPLDDEQDSLAKLL